MFGLIDAANGSLNSGQPKTLADRACDQCKQKKIRCSSGNPCARCTSKGIACSYDLARKKRGPPSKRLSMQHLRQRSSTATGDSVKQDSVMYQLQRISTAPTPATNNVDVFTPDVSLQTTNCWNGDLTVEEVGGLSPQSLSGIASLHAPAGAAVATPRSAVTAAFNTEDIMSSPDKYIFPSLPAESPTSTADPFAAINNHEFPPLPAADVWPANVNETNLLPWIDVYFKRLHPTIPILSRTTLYCDMLMRKHRTDPQYGAMLLGLSAFAMTQPVQIHERASMPSRSVQARMLMEECVRMRVDASFGESPTIEMVLTSFFLFACLFGSNQHKAARHRLREAVDLAYSLGLHSPDSYAVLEAERREQWLRTYLVLSVTERAYALQQNYPINFRGRPGVTARFMHAFGPTARDEYVSSLIYQEQSDSVSMTGLLYLMDTFDAIDESVLNCWCGHCNLSGLLEGICETFDRRRALEMFRAQRRVRECCISGNISFARSLTSTPLSQLLETQRADISVTQCWLLNRLWQLCLSHQLLRDSSDHLELRFDYACHIAHLMLAECNRLTLSAMEVHGIGFAEKLCDVTIGVVTAINSSSQMNLDMTIAPEDTDDVPQQRHADHSSYTIRQMLQRLRALLSDFRGGDHPFMEQLEATLVLLPGFRT